jgi:hypothetical protein
MFAKKKYEAANNIALELNFIASILTCLSCGRKIDKIKDEYQAHNDVRAYDHNFGEYVLHKVWDSELHVEIS